MICATPVFSKAMATPKELAIMTMSLKLVAATAFSTELEQSK
jgi:hypothetical protein